MTTIKSQIPCHKIITGGQTGVDRGALDACLSLDFPCGGWCPANRIAEDGRIENKYPLKETNEKEYHFRTRKNVNVSDGTLIISSEKLTGGTLLTKKIAEELNKPLLIISDSNSLQQILIWLQENKVNTLNIAGPRQSEWNMAYGLSYKITSDIIKDIKNRSV
ncbi:MAG: putative molybdenum carrier protein [Draconibacterium sp.]|nr:putative molybdenum carrier protein [Draconibacterium sp.]